MTRRSESLFASSALTIVLALTLFYGCRAFDPEPVIVNRFPNTFIIGAPAETTGSLFKRHLYWYGTDDDGEVVRFIYAITDSTVQDFQDEDVDEEDARFNPALDVTTLAPEPGRIVGYTAETDSVFLFTVDRGATPSKEVTFHIIAVDDRGAFDQTPARLRFLNNSLGNPQLRFRVFTWETLGGGEDWVERWAGTPAGPDGTPGLETSALPFVGFSRKFKIEWEASSPNGAVTGYRFKANQNINEPYTPALAQGGVKTWDPELRSAVYENDVAPESLPDCTQSPRGDLLDDAICPPATVRWPSGTYRLLVEAVDVALVETEQIAGDLRFTVNYPPETSVTTTDGWPKYVTPSPGGGLGGALISFADGDTLPQGAYVQLRLDGFDRTVDSLPSGSFGELCCDETLEDADVAFQVQYTSILDQVNNQIIKRTLFSFPFQADPLNPSEPDTIGINVGPMSYTVVARAVDEHLRSDPTPDEISFVGGFAPRLLPSLSPATGDSLVLRISFLSGSAAHLPYSVTPGDVDRWFDDGEFLEIDPVNCGGTGDEACPSIPGRIYTFAPRFEGTADPREPDNSIKAWTFRYITEFDPLNLIIDGQESPDLTNFINSPLPNLWQFETEEAIEIFVPGDFWFDLTGRYDPGSDDADAQAIGEWLTRRLGRASLEIIGRTTAFNESWDVYSHVRPDPSDSKIPTLIDRAGRRTKRLQVDFQVRLGTGFLPSPTRVWPDFDPADYNE